jgi:hypothetical protein
MFVTGQPVNFIDPFGLEKCGQCATGEIGSGKASGYDCLIYNHNYCDNNDASLPIQFSFHLNSESMSQLIIDNSSEAFDAFSGYQEGLNNPSFIDAKSSGPIPFGTYYIVDRPSGRLGWLRKIFGGDSKDEWFALYRNDGEINDLTVINGVERGKFRLHPGSLSLGCITFSKLNDFTYVRNLLLNTRPMFIDEVGIRYYGVITVK